MVVNGAGAGSIGPSMRSASFVCEAPIALPANSYLSALSPTSSTTSLSNKRCFGFYSHRIELLLYLVPSLKKLSGTDKASKSNSSSIPILCEMDVGGSEEVPFVRKNGALPPVQYSESTVGYCTTVYSGM